MASSTTKRDKAICERAAELIINEEPVYVPYAALGVFAAIIREVEDGHTTA